MLGMCKQTPMLRESGVWADLVIDVPVRQSLRSMERADKG